MSNSVLPHRWQPIRLPCPWDFPGKNSGVGCHFLLQWMKVKSESEVAESFLTLSDPMDCSLPGSSVHVIFQARVLEWVPLPCLLCNEDLVLWKLKKKKKILPEKPVRSRGSRTWKRMKPVWVWFHASHGEGTYSLFSQGTWDISCASNVPQPKARLLGFHSPTSISLSSFN